MSQLAILTAIETHLNQLKSFRIRAGTVVVGGWDYYDALKNIPAEKLDKYGPLSDLGKSGEFVITHAGGRWKVKLGEGIEQGTFQIGTTHEK